MSFWWEDGYVPGAEDKGQERDRARRPTGSGVPFLIKNTETKAHHLHAQYSPNLRQLISLDGVGKQDTRIRVRCAAEGTTINEFPVHCKSGFIAVSGDGTMVAVAVLKEDTIEIYELSSGDLLVSLEGGRREGFWGQLCFLPGSNRLIELRSIEYARGVSKRNIMRCWDLGFANRRDPTGDDRVANEWLNPESTKMVAVLPCEGEDEEDDDEIEEKKWEIEMWKGPIAFAFRGSDNTIMASSEQERKVSSFETRTGNCIPKQTISEGQFCAKMVYSSDYSLFALSHTGSCSVRRADTNEIVSIIEMPDVPFPVTPLAFLQNNQLLLLRINLDRHLILCDWRNPNDMIILREAGGTATDACAVSPDEKYLACWPHGFMEYFSLEAIIQMYMEKVPRLKKMTLLLMRELYLQKRAVVNVEPVEELKVVEKATAGKSKKAPSKKNVTAVKAKEAVSVPVSNRKSPQWDALCNTDGDVFRYILGFL